MNLVLFSKYSQPLPFLSDREKKEHYLRCQIRNSICGFAANLQGTLNLNDLICKMDTLQACSD